MREGVVSVSMILVIITGAVVFAGFVTQSGFSENIAGLFANYSIPLWGFLIITVIIMLLQGCFLEGAAICLIMVPILHPSVINYGFDMLSFAVVMTISVECALLTPPIGLNFFVVHGICKGQGMDISLNEVIKGSFPFFLLYLGALLLTLVFPPLVTWLPSHMF